MYIIKTLILIILLHCCGSMVAKTDILSGIQTINPLSAQIGVAEAIAIEEKLKISTSIPNPLNNNPQFNVESKSLTEMKVRIFSMHGDIIRDELHTLITGITVLTLDIQDLASGTYMIQFYTNEGSVLRRIVKME